MGFTSTVTYLRVGAHRKHNAQKKRCECPVQEVARRLDKLDEKQKPERTENTCHRHQWQDENTCHPWQARQDVVLLRHNDAGGGGWICVCVCVSSSFV